MRFFLKVFVLFSIILFLSLGLVHCGKKATGEKSKLLIYTTFYPMYSFTKILAGDYAKVILPLPGDADPAFWTPPRNILQDFQTKADLIIANGAHFEKFVQLTELPEDKLVLTAGIFNTNDLFRFHFVHSHGKAGKHSHIGINGHTWVSPLMAQKQANVIKEALIKLDPAHKDDYTKNYGTLLEKLKSLDSALKDALKNYKGQIIIVNHPSYDYLARDYGFKIKDFGVHPDDVPDETTFQKMIKFVKSHPHSKYMLWEEMPEKEVAEVYKTKIGLTPIVFSPCENVSEKERKKADYFEMMRKNIENLKFVITHS